MHLCQTFFLRKSLYVKPSSLESSILQAMQTSVDDDYLNSLPVEESVDFLIIQRRLDLKRDDTMTPLQLGKRAMGDEKPVIPTDYSRPTCSP